MRWIWAALLAMASSETDMTEAHEPTRKELKEQLTAAEADKAAMEARLARLEAAFAAKAEPATFSEIDLARLKAAREELEALRPGASKPWTPPQGPPPKFVPYQGLARARVKCATEHFHEPGEVFAVDLPVLWSDDPFEPVEEINGEYVPRTDVVIVSYRFRARAADMGQLAANQI